MQKTWCGALALLLLSSCAPAIGIAISPEEAACERDDDCIVIEPTPCGYNGGSKVAINAESEAAVMARQSPVASPGVTGDGDPSCSATGAACVAGTCEVTYWPL